MKAVSKKVARKAFELVIPFLEDWKDSNPESTVEWVVDEQKCIQHIFVCPRYTDKVLYHMHPVISVDAAHLKSAYKGTIFISLTGNNEAYILAFGISGGNEDYRTWYIFNKSFAKACPSVSFMEDGMLSLKFVIVLDRDKGLDKSLCDVFPGNHVTNCVHHIKQNVKTCFGPKAAELVFPIATAFSTIQEEKFVKQLKQVSPNAYEYLDNIDMELWPNTQWIKTQKYPPEVRLPPRYGVVTSNTSECINSMIDDYRSEGWTDLLEGVLWKMAEKISEDRQWY